MKNNSKLVDSSRRDFMIKSSTLAASLVLGNVANGQLLAVKPNAKRKIGTLEVSSIGLGCMSMAGIYNAPMPKADMVAVIRKAYENGITFFDTAEVYGPFFSEEIVGEAIKPFRNKLAIATKFGFSFQGSQTTGKNSHPDHIRAAIEGSLKRLQIETIDLFYLHRADPTVPIEEVAGTVKDLIQAGKVRNFGLSEVSPDTIRRAHAVQTVAALQTEYSLLERVVEPEILPLCEQLGISFVPWGPLARGFLTGRFDENSKFDFRRAGVPYFEKEAIRSNMALLTFVKEQAQKKGVTPAQFSLGWLQAQKPFIVPIPGTTNPTHLIENIGGMAVSFSANELKEIRESLTQLELKGTRKPESVHQNQ